MMAFGSTFEVGDFETTWGGVIPDCEAPHQLQSLPLQCLVGSLLHAVSLQCGMIPPPPPHIVIISDQLECRHVRC